MTSEYQREINILLLGETGVGKSTFINGFANYLNFDTLDEAEKGNTICLIPTRFVSTDANYDSKDIEYGYDINECHDKVGQSVTQECRTYVFQMGNILVRMIDTPGVGDTRGTDVDKINFDKLLTFIAEYKELHLICILLMPDMQRLTTSFQYCLKQLLCHLQKDASQNMVFLFTNARSTFYRPKNTLVLLKKITNEIKNRPPEVEIVLNKSTMYCLDNDSFQFLIALRNGVKIDAEEKDVHALNWIKSVNECKRLIEYIAEGKDGQPLKPHLIQDTLSINETRRLLIALNKPVAKITEKIGVNLRELESTKQDVINFNGNIKALHEKLKAYGYEYERSEWDHYPIIKFIINFFRRTKLIFASKIRETLYSEISSASDAKEMKEQFLQELEQALNEYEDERDQLVKASAKFAHFLKNNAIAAYNDSYKDYMLEQIEKTKMSDKDKCEITELVGNYKKILADYEKEKGILDETTMLGNLVDNDVSLENLNALIANLYMLKITGNEIKKLHEESKSKQGDDVRYEIVHTIESSRHKRMLKWIASKFKVNI